MDLFMFSLLDERFANNKKLAEKITKDGTLKKVAYIPIVSRYGKDMFFSPYDDKIRILESFGFNETVVFEIGLEYNKEKEKELFSCDAIVIGGGDTFMLQYLLKKRGIFDKLKVWAKEPNHVLIGISAGSIIMTPTIELALMADPNEPQVKDFEGLGLAPFLIKPHFENCLNKLYMIQWFIEAYNSRQEKKARFFPIYNNQCIFFDGKKVRCFEYDGEYDPAHY